jgi:hypothetical protein
MALQFAPQLLLLPWTGFAADHLNQRKLLMVTQETMGVLALALGILTITGNIRLWQVYVFAFLFGSAAALDAPVRQTFVAELIGDEYLHNAVALNSTSFNAGRMVGPAVAGLVIAKVGTGWAFEINGLSFAAVLISMSMFRISELYPNTRAQRTGGGFLEGFRYVWGDQDLRAIHAVSDRDLRTQLPDLYFDDGCQRPPHRCARLRTAVVHHGDWHHLRGTDRRRSRQAEVWLVIRRLSGLRDRMHFRCAGHQLLVVRHCSRGHWCCGLDAHQRNQQYDAALDRACHARPSHGPSPRNIDTSQWRYRLPSSPETNLLSEMEEMESVLARRAEALGVEIKRGLAITDFQQTEEG